MTNGKRNKRAGGNWERELAEKFREIGFNYVITSRQGSRLRDSQKVDLMNSDEDKHGRLPYNVQAKNVSGRVHYSELLSELPKNEGIVNVVLHKQTKKEGNRFLCTGKYAILHLEDFLEIIKKLKQYESSASNTGVV